MDGLFKFVLLLAALPAVLLFLKIFLPTILGWVAGLRVRYALASNLPKSYYTKFDNVFLQTGRGVVHLDHLLVSPYGIFVIKTCHLWGSIRGSRHDSWWSRSFGFSKLKFRNPLQRAKAEIELLQDLLGLESHQFHALAVFTCCSGFKFESPVSVTKPGGMLPFIQVRTEKLIGFEQAEHIVGLLKKRQGRRSPVSAGQPAGSIKARYERVSGPVGALAGVIMMAGFLYLGSTLLERVAVEEQAAALPPNNRPAMAEQNPLLAAGPAVSEPESGQALPQ